jgi:hypothetical protein
MASSAPTGLHHDGQLGEPLGLGHRGLADPQGEERDKRITAATSHGHGRLFVGRASIPPTDPGAATRAPQCCWERGGKRFPKETTKGGKCAVPSKSSSRR